MSWSINSDSCRTIWGEHKAQIETRKFKIKKGNIVDKNCYIAIDDPAKDIPIVRRPGSSYTNYKVRDSDNVAKCKLEKVKKLNLHLRDKSDTGSKSNRQAIKNRFVNINYCEKNIIWDRSSIDCFIIEGKNKLESEIEAAKRNKENNLMLYKELAQFETQFVDTIEEEVYAINYDKRLYL